MRALVNLITRKISSLLGTTPLKGIHEDITRIRELNEGLLVEMFLKDNLFNNETYLKSKKLTHFHRSVYTQNGEDGIIEEIFKRIGFTNKFFVEFGVHGVKNNSTFLLINDWKGLWIGGSDEGAKFISEKFKFLIDQRKLTHTQSWITRNNIEQIFLKNNVPVNFDFLSIDLDGNDYWIWEAIENYSPRIVCIEYNATFPPGVSWVMAYNENHVWDQTSYFGASLKAIENLGKKKGYELVCCDFAGCNAFFIRNDQNLELFERPFTAEHHYEPPRYYLGRNSGHKQGFGAY